MRVVSICLFFCFVRFSSSQEGPPPQHEEVSALNFDSPVYVCPDDISHSLIDCSGIGVHRHNETTSYMSGFFETFKEITSCTIVELKVEKTKGARTEVLVTHDICDLCENLSPDSSYHKYLKAFKFPECPIKPGKYEIFNFVPDGEDMPVNKANEARYKVTITLYADPNCTCGEERELLGCLLCEFVIEPAEEYRK